MDPTTLLRPHIQDMPAYEPILPFEVLSQQLGLPVEQIIKLDANENPYGMLPEVSAALSSTPYAHIYPDPESRELRHALANYLQVPSENLVAGAGADELIDIIMRLFLSPGDAIINCPPTFGMYAFDADIQAANVIAIPRAPDFSLDLAKIKEAVDAHHPKLICLAAPNNPDGSLLPDRILDELLKLPLIIVLDEAYIEFAPAGASRIHDVLHYDNLIVLRTFSKWAGLAGMRVGYAAFPTKLMPHVWKIKQPYNVSVAASVAATTSLKYAGRLAATGGKMIQERERLYAELKKIAYLQPYPSHANFILCRVALVDQTAGEQPAPPPALQLKQYLASEGILIRYFNKPGLQNHIRISVGKPEHTDRLLEALQSPTFPSNLKPK